MWEILCEDLWPSLSSESSCWEKGFMCAVNAGNPVPVAITFSIIGEFRGQRLYECSYVAYLLATTLFFHST